MHPQVDDLLAPTYGVIVYQEQVMQIAQALAGYTLGGADLLRRAMGKKKPEEMAKQKSIFVEGAIKNGVTQEDAERIFALLEYFAGYGFNKSHSAAYALITYQTAWLKAHYPVELLCAILTSDKEKIEKVVRTIADARAMGVTVLPPDINESDTDFKVVYTHPAGDRKARAQREDQGRPAGRRSASASAPCAVSAGRRSRRSSRRARRRARSRSVRSRGARRRQARQQGRARGARAVRGVRHDARRSGVSRARAFASIDIALERSRAASRDREAGQTNLFGLFDAAPEGPYESGASSAGDYAECEPWDRRELLVRERQSLGFYVSGHPLERYSRGQRGSPSSAPRPVAECAQMDDWAVVKLAGMVEGYREKIFKDGGGKVAFFELEDLTGA
jgi:DNA polymerase III subunit alpha